MLDTATHSQDFNKERIQTRIEYIILVVSGLILSTIEENNHVLISNRSKVISLGLTMKEDDTFNNVDNVIRLGHYLSSFLV